MPTAISTVIDGVGLDDESMNVVAAAAEIAATAPTDRSMPRVEITRVIPRATSSVGAVRRRMVIRLPNRLPSTTRMSKKIGDLSLVATSRATRMSSGQNRRWVTIAFTVPPPRQRPSRLPRR